MTWKRLLLAAAAAAAGSTFGAVTFSAAVARGDDVSPTSTQDQANRLSLFHDYGLNAVGNANDVGLPTNVGNPNDAGRGIPGAPALDLLGMPGQRLDVSLTPLVGYDANPVARRVPTGSVFGGGDLAAAYRFADGPDDPIVGQPLRATVAYDAVGAIYEGPVQSADTLQQNLSGSVRQTLFDGTIVLTSSLTDGFTMEHGSAFLDTLDAGAAGEFFFVPNVSVEAGYDFTHLQYFFKAILPAQKPTADRNTFDAKIHLYPLSQRRGAQVDEAPDVLTEILRATLRRATVLYAHVWNSPDLYTGHDYRYEANRVGFGLEGLTLPDQVGSQNLGTFGLFGRRLSADASYAHEFQDYQFANSVHSETILAGHLSPRGGQHRKDGIDVFTLRANARLLDLPRDAGTLGSYVQWDLIHDGSNIVPRRYNEFVVSGGLTYRY